MGFPDERDSWERELGDGNQSYRGLLYTMRVSKDAYWQTGGGTYPSPPQIQEKVSMTRNGGGDW